MTNRNVIFDLDGTLIDSSLGIMESFSKAFSVCNINLVRSLDSIVIGPPLMETLSLLSGTSDIIVLQ